MSNRILVSYGSYRSDRMGIRLAQFVVEAGFVGGTKTSELIDARQLTFRCSTGCGMPEGMAHEALEQLARKIHDADSSYSSPANIIGVSSPD